MKHEVYVVHTGPKVPFEKHEFPNWQKASAFIKAAVRSKGERTVQSVAVEFKPEICRCCGREIDEE